MGRQRSCSVRGCEDKISTRHLFPNPIKYPDTFAAWIKICGSNDLMAMNPEDIYRKKVVCHIHFTPSDISSNRYLKKNAIPSLNIPPSKDPHYIELTDRNMPSARSQAIVTSTSTRKHSAADTMSLHEEIIIMKTEIKEEIYDFEMPVDDVQFLNVKEEYICSDQNNLEESLEVINSGAQLLNENLVSGTCQLREEDLEKKQKLSKKRLHLKHNETEEISYLKKRILVKQDEESKTYQCADCKYATHRNYHLEEHIRVVTCQCCHMPCCHMPMTKNLNAHLKIVNS